MPSPVVSTINGALGYVLLPRLLLVPPYTGTHLRHAPGRLLGWRSR